MILKIRANKFIVYRWLQTFILFVSIHFCYGQLRIENLQELNLLRKEIARGSIGFEEIRNLEVGDKLVEQKTNIINYLEGLKYQSIKNIDSALIKYYEGISTKINDALKQKLFFQIGFIYADLGDLDSLDKYANWIIGRSQYDESHLGITIKKIGLLNQKQLYNESLSWCNILESHQEKFPAYQKFRILYIKGATLQERGKYADKEYALNLLKEALELLEINQNNEIELEKEKIPILNRIGNHYYYQFKDINASEYYTQCLDLIKEHKIYHLKYDILVNLGVIKYYFQNSPNEGIHFLKEAILSKLADFNDPMNPFLGEAYNNLGEAFLKLNAHDSALHYCQRTLQVRIPNYNPSNKYTNPTKEQLKLSNFKSKLNIQFKLKLDILDSLIKHNPSDTTYPSAMLNTFYAIDDLADVRRLDTDDSKTKINWIQSYVPFYERAIRFCVANKLNKEALYFSEKSRSIVLLDEINANQAFDSLPIDIQNQIQTFQDSIQLLTRRVPSRNDSTYSQSVQALLFYRSTYENYLSALESQHPQYYAQKVGLSRAHFFKQLKDLPRHTTYLEYFYDDQALYTFVIQEDQIYIKEQPIDSTFHLLLSDYQVAIYEKADQKTILGHLGQLGEILIPKDVPLHEELVIIPYQSLGYICWDALITDPSENRFLILDHTISSNYSLQLLRASQNKQVQTQKLLTIAPAYTNVSTSAPVAMNRSGLGPLRFNQEVSEYLIDQFDASHFIEELATKDNFTASAPTARIINLSMHAKVNAGNPDSSFLAFTNVHTKQKDHFQLYLNEIQRLKLDADLVTLSACETGLGELKSGEGIMSLGRAFTAAGAKRNIISLWQVNDQATMKIMKDFYSRMGEGVSVSHALQEAKIQYLNSASISEQHPYYWAGLQLMGSNEPIFKKTRSIKSRLVILGFFLAFILLGLFLRSKSSKNQTKL